MNTNVTRRGPCIWLALREKARRRLSFEWLEELYEAAVDEEKIASFGFQCQALSLPC
jgi:hypothetical protein